MATRSRIGILNDDGTVTSIYCHWDGYPSYNGVILVENYTDETKIRELMALGDISSLAPEIGVKHDFDYNYKIEDRESPEYIALSNMCNAYGRDRGETGIEAQTHVNVKAFYNAGEEYNYLWVNGQWQCDRADLYESAA